MTMLLKARQALICFLILASQAACGPAAVQATITPTTAQTSLATQTPRSTSTPRLTRTSTPAETSETPDGQNAGTLVPQLTAQTQLPTVNPPTAGNAPDKYQYLGQDIPDRSQFLPNRVVTITWTVKNVGTNGWTKEYILRYFSGPKPSKDVYYFTKDVPVGDTINFIVTFTTPAAPGDYDLWFKLTNMAGQNFGDLDLVFTVSNNPVRATSTPAN
ncbi:MAG: hypothetical protein IH586_06305 [Anaerolineaceae bacterium]|nr:hypothetical protein [Anaerolineaceae bacterium]